MPTRNGTRSDRVEVRRLTVIHVDERQKEAKAPFARIELWRHTQLIIDVVPGRGAGFSAEDSGSWAPDPPLFHDPLPPRSTNRMDHATASIRKHLQRKVSRNPLFQLFACRMTLARKSAIFRRSCSKARASSPRRGDDAAEGMGHVRQRHGGGSRPSPPRIP
jgi:hypothetical protein